MKTKGLLVLAAMLALIPAAQAWANTGGTIEITASAPLPKYAKSVAVYLDNAPKVAEAAVTMDQKGMVFVPHVVAVTVGGQVTFTNSDSVAHNVMGTGKNKFNLGMVGPGQSKVVTFATVGSVPLLCSAHPEMEAYVVVVPSSFFDVTTDGGKATIKNVPAGTYNLVGWSEKYPKITKSVTVTDGQTTTVELAFK